MQQISVIILTRNSEATIEKAINSAFLISQDVLIVDSGSEDNTLTIASRLKARILYITWQGYGRARNAGAQEVLHDSVFCLDSDEVITGELAASIRRLKPDPNTIYGCKRSNLLGQKVIKHGDWGSDTIYRLYNRQTTSWSLDEVHETLTGPRMKKKKIKGTVLHYTAPDISDLIKKQERYAKLSAVRYFRQNKKAGLVKRIVTPSFHFLKNYILKLGFLDGREGRQIATAGFNYTRPKSRELRKYWRESSG